MERNKRNLLIGIGSGLIAGIIVFLFMNMNNSGPLVWIVPVTLFVVALVTSLTRYKRTRRSQGSHDH